jgi:hypothetical protein
MFPQEVPSPLCPQSDNSSVSTGVAPIESKVELVEAERPTWVSVVSLTQCLAPDLALDLEVALDLGTHGGSPLGLSVDAEDALNHMIDSIWGPNVWLTIPITSYSSDRDYSIEVGEPMKSLGNLRVQTQETYVTTPDKREQQILRVKEKYRSRPPLRCLGLGLSLFMLDCEKNGLADGGAVSKKADRLVGSSGSTRKVKRVQTLRTSNTIPPFY